MAKNYSSNCYICGKEEAFYAYGNFAVIGVRGNVGWPLCPVHQALLKEEPETFRELLESVEAGKPITIEEEVTTCKKHPKYTAQRKPRTDCEDCWKLYNLRRK